MTGVSGSGKSSLAFDTLFAEGQRRFLEYLSPQARQVIRQLPKPDVDHIEGLSPTLTVRQGATMTSAYSTVASYTDLYDYLSLLFARVGEQYSPVTGKKLQRYARQEMIEHLLALPEGSRIQLVAPVSVEHESIEELVSRLQKMGFLRFRLGSAEFEAGDAIPSISDGQTLDVVVDRIVIKEGIRERLGGSVETTLDLSQGILKVLIGREEEVLYLTEVFLCPESGLRFEALEPADFNPYSPRGACPVCHGKGGQLAEEGSWQLCPACQGGRLKPESLSCRIHGYTIAKLCTLSVEELQGVIALWTFDHPKHQQVWKEIAPELKSRLSFLTDVGLDYLTLDRTGRTLSEGEAQRVLLASQIGAKLSGILYILDEPSRGLHRQDVAHLGTVIRRLQLIGNSVILVEHDPTLIAEADHIIEIGPGSGEHGGQVLFQGDYASLLSSGCATGEWLSGKIALPKRKGKRTCSSYLRVVNATCHNLDKISVDIPLGMVTGLCGVSGSGKSTLALDVVTGEIQAFFAKKRAPTTLEGWEAIQRLQLIEQRPAGISVRSSPATYIGLMNLLRDLFSKTKLARARGYTAARFSMNKKGGRCEACEGLGETRIGMEFMPDLFVTCPVCRGKRYNYETLQVLWEGYSIADVLAMSAEKALELFQNIPDSARILKLMTELGLEYLTLGQSFHTLSGGEIQRLKLIAELAKRSYLPTLYILDEPCAGLHFSDIAKLVPILQRLVDQGHSVIVVEHHLMLLAQCDWLIELGPGGGPRGGKVIFKGPPKALAKKDTPTGKLIGHYL